MADDLNYAPDGSPWVNVDAMTRSRSSRRTDMPWAAVASIVPSTGLWGPRGATGDSGATRSTGATGDIGATWRGVSSGSLGQGLTAREQANLYFGVDQQSDLTLQRAIAERGYQALVASQRSVAPPPEPAPLRTVRELDLDETAAIGTPAVTTRMLELE